MPLLSVVFSKARVDISARAVVLQADNQTRVYDGATNASVNFSDNRIASANFTDKNAGTGKLINITGITKLAQA